MSVTDYKPAHMLEAVEVWRRLRVSMASYIPMASMLRWLMTANLVTTINSLPPELIVEIMEWHIIDVYFLPSQYEAERVFKALGAMALASKRYQLIYKDWQALMLRKLLDKFNAPPPGMFDLIVRMEAIRRDIEELPRPEKLRDWDGLVAHVNDLLDADVKELLTPSLAAKVCSINLESRDIPDAQKADTARVFAKLSVYNQVIYDLNIEGKPDNRADCELGLQRLARDLNAEFEQTEESAGITSYKLRCERKHYWRTETWDLYSYFARPEDSNSHSNPDSNSDSESGDEDNDQNEDGGADDGDDRADESVWEENWDSDESVWEEDWDSDDDQTEQAAWEFDGEATNMGLTGW